MFVRVLALDTSSPAPSLALAWESADGSPLEAVEPLEAGVAERLVRHLAALLARCGTDVAALDAVAVLTGPGSFTGLRAGIAFARGLARARRIPLLTASTFQAASAAVPEPAAVDFLLDAGRGDVHHASRRGASLTESRRPIPRADATALARSAGVPVRDLDEEPPPLSSALARLALGGALSDAAELRYGRPSAAEEKLAGTAGAAR